MDSRTPPRLRESGLFADGSPSAYINSPEPGTPLSSRRHRGPHRDGFSVKKCRDVLVRHCSWIPRNYNFKDGVNQVYEVLREYLGDENLDLAIAQLNELIEVPSQWPHDEGASFQAWKHDYMLRHKDLENSHVPRLRNIIVAPINPTERLKKWREEHQERPKLSSSRVFDTPSHRFENQAKTFKYGISARARGGDWRLENALFVSSKAQGTRVLQCPSAQELHSNIWNENFGRGGKLVQERTVNLGEIVDDPGESPTTITTLKRKSSLADLLSIRFLTDMPVIRRLKSTITVPDIVKNTPWRTQSSSSRSWHSKHDSTKNMMPAQTRRRYIDPLQGRFANEVKRYEGISTVRDLPDPDSDIGKSYYCNIPIWPLPVGTYVPSPRFARKHGLVPGEVSLPGSVNIKLVPTADEMAIEKSFQDRNSTRGHANEIGLVGPFTPELFKDSGIDFPQYWGDIALEPGYREHDLEDFSDMGALGDAAQSPPKSLQSTRASSYTSAMISALTSSHSRHLDCPSGGLSNSRRSKAMAQSIGVTPKVGALGRQQCRFLNLRYDNQGKLNVPQVAVVLQHSSLISKQPLTDFAKFIQHSLSTFLCRENTAILVSELSQRAKDPPEILNFRVRHLRKSCVVTQTKHCNIIDLVDHRQSSNNDKNTTYSSHGKKLEVTIQTIPTLEMDIPVLAVELPSEYTGNHSTQTGKFSRKTLSNRVQRSKDKLRVAINRLVLEPLIVIRYSTKNEEHADSKTIMRLLQEICRVISYIFPRTTLNRISFMVKSLTRVVVNNNENGEALKAHHSCNINIFATNLFGTLLKISLIIARKREGITERMLDLPSTSEVDLNRDLPPLPLSTDLPPLRIGDHISRQSLQAESGLRLEFLQPTCYDPVRDSLKYGGIHYHTDGMRYHPEVLQHPPRTSSMLPPNTQSNITTLGTRQVQVETREPLKPSIEIPASTSSHAVPSEPHTSYNRDSSSGIMGNFIPVTSTASPSVFPNRAVNNTHNEVIGDVCVVNPNSMRDDILLTSSSQIQRNVQEGSERTDGLMTGNSIGIKAIQDLRETSSTGDDHYSIDFDDPDALAKYIRYLKGIRKQAEIRRQSPGLNFRMSQSVDGEANKAMDDNNYRKDRYMHVKPENNTDIMAQDYSEFRAGNPFTFETDAGQRDLHRLTRLTDFMGQPDEVHETGSPQKTRKRGHLKNSHSESNAFYMKKRPEPIQLDENINSNIPLHRSDSSPGTSPTRVTTSRGAAQASVQSFYAEDYHPESTTTNNENRFFDPRKSPTHAPRRPNPPSKYFDDLPEGREMTFNTHPSIPERPRSPVKKIFGEGGWLGNTTKSKGETTTPKKPGLVEKIKLKIEEIGLRADLSPIKYSFKNEQEKSWERSTFPISLNPAQQAELYLDIELLICDSANTFLMHEYQNGRMSVDSLKRVIDFWKSKGRPQVLEFHYDQATQRDLIVANQKTFRFYGPNANNPLQVHAMLYAWKNNAREMAVRTFCYPDSMIRKHIQDTFVMLDFLGGHPFQYIAAHEVQGKLVKWVQEAQVHISARPSSTPGVQKVDRYSKESLGELVVDNPWHNAGGPIESPIKQKN